MKSNLDLLRQPVSFRPVIERVSIRGRLPSPPIVATPDEKMARVVDKDRSGQGTQPASRPISINLESN